MWKNIVEPETPQMITWGMRIACWIPNGTNAHSEYVVLIAFPLQQLHERVLVLRYTYCTLPVFSCIVEMVCSL